MLEQKETNENTIEEISDIENILIHEKTVEEIDSEERPDFKNTNIHMYKKPNFVDTLTASLIDLIVVGAISSIIVFGSDAMLRLAGYGITQKFQMIFIVYMVIMVLYMSIMESTKCSATIGKKIAGLTITKR